MVRIALDAGHGQDTYEQRNTNGVEANGEVFEEHHFNASVVSYLKELLEYNGFSVLLTQPLYGKEVSLKGRTDLANREDVDLFWSVHANASNDPSIQGTCCFYWHSSDEGKRLAYLFAKHMQHSGIHLHGNGVHASKIGEWTNLHVIRETNMVAILTENGFMTNEEDLSLMKMSEYRRKVARNHAQAISEYFDHTYRDPEEQGDSIASWKREAVEWMYEEGLLEGEEWKQKVDEPLPLWAQAVVLKRLYDELKN